MATLVSSIMFHSVNSRLLTIKQGHFNKTELKIYIFTSWINSSLSFKGRFLSSQQQNCCNLSIPYVFSTAQPQMLTCSQTIFSAEQRLWCGKCALSQMEINDHCGFPHSGLESMA